MLARVFVLIRMLARQGLHLRTDESVCMSMCVLACLCAHLRASVRVCMLRHVRSLTHARFCARQHANALIGMLMRAFAC